jgi:hypothetical protein
MEKQICKTCELGYDGKLFYSKVGKPFDPSTAKSLVCQYAGDKSCLNKCKKIDPSSDSWEKRAAKPNAN